MNSRSWFKKFILFFFGILLVAALVALAYLFGQGTVKIEINQPTPSSEPTSPPTEEAVERPDETANWETYTNLKYGYQFKHPRGWIFTPTVIGDESKPLYVIRETLKTNTLDDYFISIKTWNNPSQLSLVNWLQFMKSSGALPLPSEDVSLVANDRVGSEPAFRIWSDPLSKGQEPGKCFQACPVLSVYFTHGNRAYLVEHTYLREVDQASQEIFDLLLSTFEFLN